MKFTVLSTLAGAALLLAPSLAAQAPERQQTPAQSGRKDARASAKAESSTEASARRGQSSAEVSAGTTFEAALTKSLDVRKSKEGDRVEARTKSDVKSEGRVVIPRNSKLIGRVTRAEARGEGRSESSLGIVFERAILKDGREVLVHAAIQAIAASQTMISAATPDESLMGSASGSSSAAATARPAPSSTGGGALGAVGSTVGAATSTAAGVAGGAVGAASNTAASVTGGAGATGAGVAGALTSESRGVVGLKGLTLNSEASSATEGSLITSTSRNVRLDSGTRMMLRVVAQSQ